MIVFLAWPMSEYLWLPCHPFSGVLCLVTTSAHTWLPSIPTIYITNNTQKVIHNSPHKLQNDNAGKYNVDNIYKN